jgi:hypothetical protein
MRITLERVTNVVVILSCLFVVGSLAYRRGEFPSGPRVFAAGGRIQDAPGLGLKSAQRTLILATSSSCRHCVVSLPFYQKLAAAAKRGGTRLVAVTPEPPSVNRAFLESNSVPVDADLSIPQSGIAVQNTPLLILVRKDGTIIDSWVGELSTLTEWRVLRLAAGG